MTTECRLRRDCAHDTHLSHRTVYTFQCSSESSHRNSVILGAIHLLLLSELGVNVPDESALNWVQCSHDKNDLNRSLIYLFYKIIFNSCRRMTLIICIFFVESIFVGLTFQLFFYTTLDC